MDLTCRACSTKLAIPDAKVPQNAIFQVTCPKCQEKIRVSTKAESVAAPPPEPESLIPETCGDEDAPALVSTEADFVENQQLALICFEDLTSQAGAKAALEGLGYTVHLPATAEDALQKMRRHQYALVLLHESYGGSVERNLVLTTIQPMAMPLRRHMCVGLVGPSVRTFDNMTAFARSVNFVVAERELGKIKAITRQAVAANDQFYRVFREALRDAGKQ